MAPSAASPSAFASACSFEVAGVPSTRRTHKTGDRSRVDEKDVRRAPLFSARKHFGVVGLFFDARYATTFTHFRSGGLSSSKGKPV